MKSFKIKNNTESTKIDKDQLSFSFMLNIEKLSQSLLSKNISKCTIPYNILITNNLMSNGKCHIVAKFKDYLIEDDHSEFLRRFYKGKESRPRLKKLFDYYEETSVIFANYTPLPEAKYIYKNIMKKQKVIDEQQDLEEKMNYEKKHKKKKDDNNNIKNGNNNVNKNKVFDTFAYDEILNQSESILRIVFGIEKNKKDSDKNKINFFDDSDEFNNGIEKIIEKISKIERNIENKKVKIYLTLNNNMKNKLKLILPKNINNSPINNNNNNNNNNNFINSYNTINNNNIEEYRARNSIIKTLQKKSLSPTLKLHHIKNNDSNLSNSSKIHNNNNNKNIKIDLLSSNSLSNRISHKNNLSISKINNNNNNNNKLKIKNNQKYRLLSFNSMDFKNNYNTYANINNINNNNNDINIIKKNFNSNIFMSTIASPNFSNNKFQKKIRGVIGRNIINFNSNNNYKIYNTINAKKDENNNNNYYYYYHNRYNSNNIKINNLNNNNNNGALTERNINNKKYKIQKLENIINNNNKIYFQTNNGFYTERNKKI